MMLDSDKRNKFRISVDSLGIHLYTQSTSFFYCLTSVVCRKEFFAMMDKLVLYSLDYY